MKNTSDSNNSNSFNIIFIAQCVVTIRYSYMLSLPYMDIYIIIITEYIRCIYIIFLNTKVGIKN